MVWDIEVVNGKKVYAAEISILEKAGKVFRSGSYLKVAKPVKGSAVPRVTLFPNIENGEIVMWEAEFGEYKLEVYNG